MITKLKTLPGNESSCQHVRDLSQNSQQNRHGTSTPPGSARRHTRHRLPTDKRQERRAQRQLGSRSLRLVAAALPQRLEGEAMARSPRR